MNKDINEVFKRCALLDGMNLEENSYKPLKMRMDKMLGKPDVSKIGNKIYNTYKHGIKLIHNDTSSISEYNHGDGVDIILIWGYNKKEYECKNLKWYKRRQGIDWGEEHILSRFSSDATDKTVIATYEDGNFAGTLKDKFNDEKINTIYVEHKVTSQYDGKVRHHLHKKFTPELKEIEGYYRIQDKKKEFKDKRRGGVKQDTINNDSVIRIRVSIPITTTINSMKSNIEDNNVYNSRYKFVKLKNWAEFSGEKHIEPEKSRTIYTSWGEYTARMR